MSAIKGLNTKPEILIRRMLHARGFRYRLKNKHLPGNPDLVFPRYSAAIFVHGCFWHVHECPVFRWPSTRTEWWKEKLLGNKTRDEKNLERLLDSEWRVCIVWECSLKGKYKLNEESLADQISSWLGSDRQFLILEGKKS
ncbi:very short patch repair endonuclease [Lacimicrobium alkaliphilum]|uniref:very short patch repair endonuclease n=1 Tax=Lacimicrobium alkaliphilum TaxID=1526571 RepID=UPI001E31BFEE|nr:very short patch repair endonuclease [Lacimicrobium alkaliphilum]